MKKDKRLTYYMNGHWAMVIISIVSMCLEVFCELRLPDIAGNIYDYGVNGGGDKDYIIKWGLLMLLTAAVSMSGGIICMKTSSIASQGFAFNLRNGLYNKISSFSFKNIDSFSTASLTTRMTNDITTLQNVIMMSLRMFVRAPAMIIISAFYVISINSKMSATLLGVLLPIIIITISLVMKFGFPMFEKMQKKIDSVNRVVQENLIGIRVVKAFVRGDHEKKKFRNASDDLAAQGAKAAGLVITAMPVMMLVFNFATIFVYWKGGNNINDGAMTVGEFTKFSSYLMQMLMNLVMVSMVLIMIVRGKACANRVSEVLSADVDIKEKDQTISVTNNGKVEFKNVSFRYDIENHGDNILSNISFTAMPGEIIGIVGGTGSGKSSLVGLIPRLYDVTGGQVLIDGVDVRDYSIKALRDSIGVVLQNNILFSGTIRQNICWGKKDAGDEEVVEVCKSAQAHDFIMEQPHGYNTVLSQGGLNLSGGQKQRLCIARAMIKKPKILILDDSTSAVDTATEALIRKSFYNELKDATVFIIAQRITSVSDADKIIVLDDGEIKGIGTHDDLLENNEIYQEIYNTQQKGGLQ